MVSHDPAQPNATPTPGATPSPGWYKDPWHQAPWRYFDGTEWTGHTSDAAPKDTTSILANLRQLYKWYNWLRIFPDI